MTILAQDLINDIAVDLSDTNFVTWSAAELLTYLNAGTLRVCVNRPDASSSVENLKLVPGTKQNIPSTSRRLLSINRNMGADGVTPGKIITTTDQRSMDLYNPNWHKDTAKTAIDHFMYDEETPDTFFVTPPVHAITSVYVEAKLANNPTKIVDAATENVQIDDVYRPALEHWMLYKAYEKETDSAQSISDSRFNYQAFHDLLGIKVKVDVAYSPSREIKDGKS